MSVLAFANALFEKSSELVEFDIPIAIDKMSVDLRFVLTPYRFSIEIVNDTNDILYDENDSFSYIPLTPERISEFIQSSHTKLDTLYFNNKIGKFFSTEDLIDVLKYRVFDKYVGPLEECSVCYESTITTTDCKHACCFKCMQKMTLCPLCRTEL